MGAKVQERDQRHTLDLQVPSPIPEPPATGPATGGFGAGDTVHLERARPGPDRLVLRWQWGSVSRARAGRLREGRCGSRRPAQHSPGAVQEHRSLLHAQRWPSFPTQGRQPSCAPQEGQRWARPGASQRPPRLSSAPGPRRATPRYSSPGPWTAAG